MCGFGVADGHTSSSDALPSPLSSHGVSVCVHARIDCRCNVRTGSPIWAVTSIACTLMVMIYALGNISGANFNLAVSPLLAIAGKENMQRWASTWLVKL